MHESRWERSEVVPMQEKILQIVLSKVAQRSWQAFDLIIGDIERVEGREILSEDVRNFE